ncbi:ATP/GTP-binding protein [Sulfurovum sp.]|uniref:AAA family ATPase n=1 Tax=Sulfurovum sp. TaxID=1969726 RepID=UPI003568E01B
MLLKFGAQNFFSFKEGFEVSLELGQTCPKSISHNKNFANVLAIKGANASGKTNVLKVLSFIKEFVTESFSYKPEDEIFINSYFDSEEPTNIYVIFLDNNIQYKYEVELTKHEIISETIYKKTQRSTKLIERKKNKLDYRTEQFKELDIVKLRKNASIVSTAKQYEVKELDIFYDLFLKIMVPNVSYLGMHDKLPNTQIASSFYYTNEEVFSFVKKLLIQSDTGINDIKIFEREDEENDEKEYFPIFYHTVGNTQKTLTIYDQSSGVKTLYQRLGFYKIALEEGSILVLDEFDINLHPDILPTLIELFEDKKTNTKNAQLIFTTHNSDIMDNLGKYKVVLVNKEENESFLYRLDEIPGDLLRNDRSIFKVYNTGKIGGKPKINYGEI